jgi:anti-anti-sigma factor
MELLEAIQDGVTVISPKGNINRATSPELQARLSPLVEEGKDVVVDLSEAATVSSAGLRVMFIIAKAAGEKGKFVLASPNEMVADILNVTGFASLITVKDDVEAAISFINS